MLWNLFQEASTDQYTKQPLSDVWFDVILFGSMIWARMMAGISDRNINYILCSFSLISFICIIFFDSFISNIILSASLLKSLFNSKNIHVTYMDNDQNMQQTYLTKP